MGEWKRATGIVTATAAAAVTAAAALLGTAGSAEARQVATIKAEATAVRVAPAMTAAVRTRLPKGTPVEVHCQDAGETVELTFGTSGLWDFLPAYDGWVSD